MINDVNLGQSRPIDGARGAAIQQPATSKVDRAGSEPLVSSALSGAIEHMVQQGMPIDLDHIVAVRNAIADGQYPVDPMKIAQRIVDFDQPKSTQ